MGQVMGADIGHQVKALGNGDYTINPIAENSSVNQTPDLICGLKKIMLLLCKETCSKNIGLVFLKKVYHETAKTIMQAVM